MESYGGRGYAGELKAAAELSQYFDEVLIPWGDDNRYDIVVDRGGDFYKVQVKTASNTEGPRVFWMLQTSAGGSQRRYRADEVDFFALYQPETDRCYFYEVGDEDPPTRVTVSFDGSTAQYIFKQDELSAEQVLE